MSKNELEMMLRKNTPSHKMAMQAIIGEVLRSKGKMSTNEFISNLQVRGIEGHFNQASTGYVSGISYSYQGLVMQGSKLGNGFKWSTIKNIINYEQERDRQRIYEANVRSEYAIHLLRPGNNHARGNTGNTQRGIVKYGQLPDLAQIHGLFIFSQSFTAGIFKAATQSAERATDPDSYRDVDKTFKIPKIIALTALLDGRNGGGDLGPACCAWDLRNGTQDF